MLVYFLILAEWSLILSGFSVVPSLVFKVPLLFQVDKLFSQFVPSRVHWYQKSFCWRNEKLKKAVKSGEIASCWAAVARGIG